MADSDVRDVHVVVATDRFDDDLTVLLGEHGFRVDAIYPADAPTTAIVSAHGVRLHLESSAAPAPVTLHLLSDDRSGERALPGGTRLVFRPFTTAYELPDNAPSLVVSHDDGATGAGRAGMRYRDLLPDRWGGRFVASHISIPDGGLPLSSRSTSRSTSVSTVTRLRCASRTKPWATLCSKKRISGE